MKTELPEKEWFSTGRVEFHLNDGFTKVMVWVGGGHTFDLPTDTIPAELRKVGSWLRMRFSPSKGWTIEGPGQPDPYIEAWLAGKKALEPGA